MEGARDLRAKLKIEKRLGEQFLGQNLTDQELKWLRSVNSKFLMEHELFLSRLINNQPYIQVVEHELLVKVGINS